MTMQQYILLVAQKKKTEAPNQEIARSPKLSKSVFFFFIL